MPEGVEVQVQVDGLRTILGDTIKGVKFHDRAEVLINYSAKVFTETIVGSRITDIFRIGKYIVMELRKALKGSNEAQYLYLLTHLGMSGTYLINSHHRHGRILFELKDHVLVYKDMRYFGNLKILTPEELRKYIGSRKLGVDALSSSKYEIEMELIKKIYDKRHTNKPIKQLLLDQSIISGLGNIYANEVLFASKIHPLKTPSEISFSDIRNIAHYTVQIMELSYEVGGSSLKDFTGVNQEEGGFVEYMQIYGRKGQPCFECNDIIQVVKVSGRSSFYCPTCQEMA